MSTPNEATPSADGVERLATTECWSLIEARSFGRLAVDGADGMPNVFPVNFTVHDGSIYIRSAPGSKLVAIAQHPVAAFEIDGEDARFRWSVVLRGGARRLTTDVEIRESGIKALPTSTPAQKFNYICVTPTTISGRRFPVHPGEEPAPQDQVRLETSPVAHVADPPPADASRSATDQSRAERPVTIVHHPPA